MDIITNPFADPLYSGSLLASALAGLMCGLIGPYFVWRKLSNYANALSHAALTPLAVAKIYQLPMLSVLVPFTLLFSLFTHWLGNRKNPEMDSVLSILFAGFMALGLLLIVTTGGGSSEAIHYLFGDILLISQTDLILMIVTTLITALFVISQKNKLVLLSLNPEFASVYGVKSHLQNLLLILFCGLVVIFCLSLMGIILTTSLLLVPAMTAQLFSKTLRQHLLLSSLLGVLISCTGWWLALELDFPIGPSIAFFSLVVFSLASMKRIKT